MMTMTTKKFRERKIEREREAMGPRTGSTEVADNRWSVAMAEERETHKEKNLNIGMVVR